MLRFLRSLFSGNCSKCGGNFIHLEHPCAPAVCENCSPEIKEFNRVNAVYPIDAEVVTRRALAAMKRIGSDRS